MRQERKRRTSRQEKGETLRRKGTAFTLIELLIVVAIIAILALIAVPNFLEAQTRAKVSRVHSDHRALVAAVEAYCVDHGTYPRKGEGGVDDPWGLIKLTTPIAYITNSLMTDPFLPAGKRNSNVDVNQNYYYATFEDEEMRERFTPPGFPAYKGHNLLLSFPGPYRYYVAGYGPDFLMQWDDDPNLKSLGLPCDRYLPYDPTNGTVSYGDIVRFGPG